MKNTVTPSSSPQIWMSTLQNYDECQIICLKNSAHTQVYMDKEWKGKKEMKTNLVEYLYIYLMFRSVQDCLGDDFEKKIRGKQLHTSFDSNLSLAEF